ncbi:choline/glycine/proline betaine transport protein [Lipingzhangella halophila]|uniref:Choline/glycine/proline betaine transport protein n=2 Tax=Lipingzhangella halophila TaxID=1783352 RepID=A0A7W7RK07_9ACTN|nr:choline/glycine/proline betaine transport protein [Lipingzhangella halophila]
MVAPDHLNTKAAETRDWIGANLGAFYILATTFFLVFALVMMVSKYGGIRLGPDSSRPEFSTGAWFAMLFTAGMGIGLVFYGVAEPTAHRLNDAIGRGDTSADVEAFQYTMFHWGFHPWAVYIALGLALGYFCFRKGLPMRPAAALYPLIGNRIYGWIGNLVDILAVFGTLFGLAASLGLGTLQINTGLDMMFGLPNNQLTQTIIICLITATAVVSVIGGIDKGIRRLSVINLWLAAILLVFVFIVGSQPWMISMMVSGTGAYLQNLPAMSLSFPTETLDPEGNGFATAWTVFYWGWWISWSPFVGMFLARISYGRTIRQFVVGTLFAPVGVSAVWFGVFGGSGILADRADPDNTIGNATMIDGAEDQAMYLFFQELPLPQIVIAAIALLAIIVVTVFFVTSSDSGSLVVDMLTNGGDPHPVKIQRAGWAIAEGLITIVLLIIGGEVALDGLQAAAVATGLPFAAVLVVVCIGLIKALKDEHPSAYTPLVPVPSGQSGGAVGGGAYTPGHEAGATTSATPASSPPQANDGEQ